MRDTSQNLVINKQTVHPIKSLTSPCSSPLNLTVWSVHIKVYQTGKKLTWPWQGLNPRSPLFCSPGFLPPPVCLRASHRQVSEPRSQSELSSFIAKSRSHGWSFVPRRRGKCHICYGFVNSTHLLWKMTGTSWSYKLLQLCGCRGREGVSAHTTAFYWKGKKCWAGFKVAVFSEK